jgi:hypothetical protein
MCNSYLPPSKSHHQVLTALSACCCHEQLSSVAERLAEQLDLCGIQKEALSSRARLSLQLLASIASKLQLAEARPELVLAAWAVLLVKESRAAATLVSIAGCCGNPALYLRRCGVGNVGNHRTAVPFWTQSQRSAEQQSQRQLLLFASYI